VEEVIPLRITSTEYQCKQDNIGSVCGMDAIGGGAVLEHFVPPFDHI
jgi:hypothetical protein